jgi:hypothetical protein
MARANRRTAADGRRTASSRIGVHMKEDLADREYISD